MKFKIVAVGKIKEKFFSDAIAEYSKRIGRFATLEIVQVPECLFNGTPNEKEIDKILLTEAQAIEPHLKGFVVVLDINGKPLSSQQIAQTLDQTKQTNSVVTFVIGSSHGLCPSTKSSAHLLWSMGEITLPHQLARVVLCEQIYRICTIWAGSSYHK